MDNNEEWYLEIEMKGNKYIATLKNDADELYEDAMYVVDMTDGDVIKVQAYGYFKKDWDLKLEALELIRLYRETYE